MSNFVSLLAALSLIDAASVVWRLPERHIYKKTKFKGEQTMELPFVAGSNDNVAKFCISTTFRDLKKFDPELSLHSKGWLWNSRVVEPSTMNTNFTSVDDTFEHEKPLESKRACFKAKFYLPPTLYPGTNYFLKLSSKGSWFKISSSKRVIVVQHRDPNDTSDHGDFNSPINRKSGAFLSLERNFLHIALLFFYLPWQMFNPPRPRIDFFNIPFSGARGTNLNPYHIGSDDNTASFCLNYLSDIKANKFKSWRLVLVTGGMFNINRDLTPAFGDIPEGAEGETKFSSDGFQSSIKRIEDPYEKNSQPDEKRTCFKVTFAIKNSWNIRPNDYHWLRLRTGAASGFGEIHQSDYIMVVNGPNTKKEKYESGAIRGPKNFGTDSKFSY